LSYAEGELSHKPPLPANYLAEREQAILDEYCAQLVDAVHNQQALPAFPEAQIKPYIDNTWHDTAEAVVGNWMGCIYQLTNSDRRKAFMDGINPEDPLGINHD